MEPFQNLYKVDLRGGTAPVVPLKQIYFGDENAQRVGASVFSGAYPVPLSGTCAGTAILSDGTTVPLTGHISGNTAYVDLIEECYAVEGIIRVFVKIISGGIKCTLLTAVGTVVLTETDIVIDPDDTIIPSVAALIAEIQTAIGSIPADYSALLESIAPFYNHLTFPVAAGQLCWYSGVLYRAIVDIPVSESWTAAHWQTTNVSDAIKSEGSRISSAIASTESTTTASAPHPTGSYFWISGVLYQATADIARGAAIVTSGTGKNCKPVPGGLGNEVSGLKSAIVSDGSIVSNLHNLVDYKYHTEYSRDPNPSVNNSLKLGIKRFETLLILNGTLNYSNEASTKVKLNGGIESTISTDTITGWNTDTVSFVGGHTYRVTLKIICGTTTSRPGVGILPVGSLTYANTATYRDDTTHISEFTAAPNTEYNVVVVCSKGAAYVDSKMYVIIHDVTAESESEAETIKNHTNLRSRFAGKKISIIGDSIDTFDQAGYKIEGYNMYYPRLSITDVNQTWWKQVIDNSGASLEVNASWSGSRVTDTHPTATYPDFYDRVSVLGSPDVIFVTLGTNDSNHAVALGDYDFTTAYTSLSESTFRPAYIKGVKALQALYPDADIICIAEMMEAAYRDSIITIANTLGCVFIDAGDYIGENGVHPGIKGMLQIASLVLFPTDSTLTQPHMPADAKAVYDKFYDKFGEISNEISNAMYQQTNNAIDGVFVLPQSYVEQGSISAQGVPIDPPSAARIRTKYPVYVKRGSTFTFASGNNCRQIYWFFFKDSGTLETSGAWVNVVDRTIEDSGYLLFAFSRQDQTAAIAPSDYDASVVVRTPMSRYGDELLGMDAEINLLHNLINYEYDKPYNLPPSGGTGPGAIGIKRVKNTFTLNNVTTPEKNARIKISGDMMRLAFDSSAVLDWEGIQLTQGHTYLVKAVHLSGTSTANTPNAISVYREGERAALGKSWLEGETYFREFTYDGTPVNLVYAIAAGASFTDYKCIVTLEDVTGHENDRYDLPKTIVDDYDATISTNSQGANAGIKLKVVSYNVAAYNNDTEVYIPTSKEINFKKMLCEIAPDILAVQEDKKYITGSSGRLALKSLYNPIFPYEYHEQAASALTCTIRSKTPAVTHDLLEYSTGRWIEIATYEINGKTLLFGSTHPVANYNQTGIDSEESIAARLVQYQELVQWLNGEITLNRKGSSTPVSCPAYDWCVMCGDYNTITATDMTNFKTTVTNGGLKIANGDWLGWIETNYKFFDAPMCLDNVIVSENVIFNSIISHSEMFKDLYSDHVPFEVTVTLQDS